jgi:glucose/arabinose dehydrogenase
MTLLPRFRAALLLLTLLAAGLVGLPARAALLAEALVASGLDTPMFALAPWGDPRLFILERPGRILILKDGSVRAAPFLDIATSVGTSGEGGLLGLAFPPDFAASGAFYVYYTDTAGDSVISRFFVSGADPDVADPAETVILTVGQPYSNHNGGTIAFGGDGFLYFSPGDGGSGNDPGERAQDPTSLLGKMLRIDVGLPLAPGSTPVPGTGYGIPVDNPWAAAGDGVRDEIWAFGLRNPYRFSFDRNTGDLWIADVGQDAIEEIDFEPRDDPGGRNWGWDVMEADQCNVNDPAPALIFVPLTLAARRRLR